MPKSDLQLVYRRFDHIEKNMQKLQCERYFHGEFESS